VSRRIEAQTVKARVQTADDPNFDRSSILDSVHAVETVEITVSEAVCESPLCDVRFPQTGLKIEPVGSVVVSAVSRLRSFAGWPSYSKGLPTMRR
jgi:hypothetical protein